MAAGDITQGRRVEYPNDWRDSRPGDYCKVPHEDDLRRADGQPVWYIRDPRGRVGALVNHSVTEHDDGTITVSPSILDGPYEQVAAACEGLGTIRGQPGGWHGFLEKGQWREV